MNDETTKTQNGESKTVLHAVAMPFFVQSAIDGINYRGTLITNNPVNLYLCQQISKAKFAWYPDNIGRPTIKFHGCNSEWVYDQTEDRDTDFDRIAKIVTLK